MPRPQIDPKLDLVLERTLDVPRELVWKCWTEPEHLKPWFVPKPWSVGDVEIDLRPGGIFRSVMRDPDGKEYPNLGCFLEVVPNERLVWTDAVLAGFRPAIKPVSGAGLFLTAMILLEPAGPGGRSTKYTAIGVHGSVDDRNRHEQMGFHQGWGICADQLVAYIKSALLK
jgi:uncharacterized protein YndB with AHSA1/START domain